MPTQVQTALGIILSTATKSYQAGVFGSFGWSGEAVDIIAGKLKVEFLKSLLKVFGVKPGKANKPVLVVLALEKLVQRSVLGAEAALELAKAAATSAAAVSVARQGAGRGQGRMGEREGGRAGGSPAPAEGGSGGGGAHVGPEPLRNPAADVMGGEGVPRRGEDEGEGEDEEGVDDDDDDDVEVY